jgi:UDP:flavonoid glycosyltransferase YjiC (YdhE family)
MVRFLGVPLSELIFKTVRPLAFAYHARPLNRLRRENGMAIFPDIHHTYTHADYTLYADTPGLVPVFDSPPNHHYLGPIIWSPPCNRPDWWDDLPGDRATVYVTLGSSGRVGVLSLILRVLGRLNVNVIVATAGRVRPDSVPGNVWIADYLPGEEAAARSAIVICNGGSPTVHQALNAGVPVLGLPTNMDQYLNMQYVQEAGAGIWLRSDRVNMKVLRGAVESLLRDDAYCRDAGKISQEFARYKAVDRFGKLLEGWLGTS